MRVALYVPCYNGAVWLADCLSALLAQDRSADEVAVVDDGSTDASSDIVRSFAPRVRLISHDRNRGLAVARNSALSALECDVLASVDADVVAAPDWLGHLLAAFDSPRTAAVGGKLLEAHQSRPADRWRARHMAQHSGDFPRRNPPVLPGANVAVRRAVVRALGGYDVSFRTNYEDADLQHRLIERGHHCRYTPEAVAHHQRADTPGSVLRTYWGWLRPADERIGLFDTHAGLDRRRAQLLESARPMLWQDMTDGEMAVGYLSLAVALLFPLADAHHAASLAKARHDDPIEFLSRGAGWLSALRRDQRTAQLAADVSALAWWPGEYFDVPSFDASAALQSALDTLPSAWWPALTRARISLDAGDGWASPAPRHPITSFAPTRSPRAYDPLAVIEHGPTHLRERVLVTRVRTASTGHASVPAHRIGWLPPSPLQQSLLATGVIVEGDHAALDAVPPWRPDQIDPLLSLDELTGAEAALRSGETDRASWRALGALLIARRAYTAFAGERRSALQRSWPEAADLFGAPVQEIVRLARALVEEWLFVWEGNGPTTASRSRFKALRGAATAA